MSKVIILGLDGATFKDIIPWVEKGYLPNFKKVMDNGSHAVLESTIPSYTIPAWPSMVTGCNPAKHGLYGFFKENRKDYTYEINIRPSTLIKKPAMWDLMGDKKVAVIGVPGTYPPKKVNGYMVSCMFTPRGAKFTYPKSFQNSLNGYDTFFRVRTSKNVPSMVGDVKRLLSQRMELAISLWTSEKLDFLMVVDNGTDRLGHELTKYLDEKNVQYEADKEHIIIEYYQLIDSYLEKIINMIDDDTNLFIVSDHGMQSIDKFINLNSFLMDAGYMKVKNNPNSRLRYELFKYGITPMNAFRTLRKLGVERVITDRLNPQKKFNLLKSLMFSSNDIDWTKTKAFASGCLNGVRINLEGRQPKGCVKISEYESLCKEIMDVSLQWEVISGAYLKNELYQGEYLDDAPDIILTPIDRYDFFSAYSFSAAKKLIKPFGTSGCHHQNGIFMSYGKNVAHKDLGVKNIYDIMPTTLDLMGIEIPNYIDGEVIS